MTGVTEKTISRSVTEYNKNLSNQCNLSDQIEQAHDNTELMAVRWGIEIIQTNILSFSLFQRFF